MHSSILKKGWMKMTNKTDMMNELLSQGYDFETAYIIVADTCFGIDSSDFDFSGLEDLEVEAA